jgi:hypothetical protein
MRIKVDLESDSHYFRITDMTDIISSPGTILAGLAITDPARRRASPIISSSYMPCAHSPSLLCKVLDLR